MGVLYNQGVSLWLGWGWGGEGSRVVRGFQLREFDRDDENENDNSNDNNNDNDTDDDYDDDHERLTSLPYPPRTFSPLSATLGRYLEDIFRRPGMPGFPPRSKRDTR